MKRVSFWAKQNTYTARVLIIVSEIFLFLLASRLGFLLLHSGIHMPGIAIVVPLSVFSIALLLARYGKALKQRNSKLYWRQRLCFFLVGLSAFLLTSFFVSSEKLLTWNTYSSLSGGSSQVLVLPAPSAANHLSAKQEKAVTHLLKKMRKHNWLKWVWIFLIIAAGLFLLAFVAALSCSLSCDGNGALAILVLVLGGGGIIFLCAWLIHKLLQRKSVKNMQTALVGGVL